MSMWDGTVIPSYLTAARRGAIEDTGNMSNTSLRVGEVKEIVYPGEAKSYSKRYIEYTVNVSHRDGDGPEVTTVYGGCIVGNLFGAGGDMLRYTLRPDASAGSSGSKNKIVGIGNKVLLMCINGSKTDCIIIGGIRDPNTGDTGDKDSKELGHNLLFEFNGVRAIINKDGEFQIGFNGATATAGGLKDGVDADAGGALFSFRKNGDILLAHDDQILKLDHESQSWSIDAKKNVQITAEDGFSAVVQRSINMQAKNRIDLLTVNEAITFTAPNVMIGSDQAAEHLVLGDAYRSAQSEMNQGLLSSLQSIAQTLQTMMTNLTTASTALKIPITGGIAASPSFVLMTKDIVALAKDVSQMASDIEGFEGKSGDFLSDNHTTEK